MRLVHQDAWAPKGVDSLEPVADTVVRSTRNILVSAGPGAGKTELLAQRACFLLETGVCPYPQRILAISFKRDAAKNLNDRVEKRCGEYANRFDSFTLDAFAKSIVDRFLPALPNDWKPRRGYEIATGGLRTDEMRDWLTSAGFPIGQTQIDLQAQSNERIRRCFDLMAHGQVLPYVDAAINPILKHWGLLWWRRQLMLPEGTPSLSFPMINRLAAFLLRENGKITAALRSTYAFVFIDEFQDTTAAQYDLVRAAFLGSAANITAVGDVKQRIMLWAGAKSDVFDAYKADFQADSHNLLRNYRSAPELVRMQHVIAQAVEAGTPVATATKVMDGSCRLLEFCTPEEEADYLATLIEKAIREDGKNARDFCILSRQLTGNMIVPLKTALTTRGVKLRDESALQDLLAEPVVKWLLAIFQLATRPRDPNAWSMLTREIASLLGLDENNDGGEIDRMANRLLRYTKDAVASGTSISDLPEQLLSLIGVEVFKSAYRQYGNGSFLADIVKAFSAALKGAEVECGSPREAVDDLMGVNIVPAMTIHKSKGLEFHTVIFLGLEDSQWWSFASQADEEKRSFFVAFSRAIARVFFTYADFRDGRWGRRAQSKTNIGDLYTILQQAGVPSEDCRQLGS